MTLDPKAITCGLHGPKLAAFVCQHLVRGAGLGFCEAAQADLQAWCNRCDEDLEAEGWAWNDVSERNLGLTVICHICYEDSRDRNEAATRKPAGLANRR